MDRLQSVRRLLWLWVAVMSVYLVLWTWWGIAASTYRYEVRQSTGQLDSQRWSVDFVFTGTLLFGFVLPLTLAFALDSPLRHGRRVTHAVITVLLFLYGIVIMGFWADYYRHANDPDAANRNNPANDRRWCNVNYALPGVDCPQTAPTPGLVQSQLTVDGVFLWKFWFLVVWLMLLVLDLLATQFLLRGATLAYESELMGGEEEKEPLLPETVEAKLPSPFRDIRSGRRIL